MKSKNHLKPGDRGELIFWKETIDFTRDWAKTRAGQPWIQDKSILEIVARIAAEPDWAVWYYDNEAKNEIRDAYQAGKQAGGRFDFGHHRIHKIAELYQRYPDFFPALLSHLRERWARLEKSTAGQIKRFLALGFAVNPNSKDDEKRLIAKGISPLKYQCDPGSGEPLSVPELALAFQNACGRKVKVECLLADSRDWVHARLASIAKCNREFFDATGALKLN